MSFFSSLVRHGWTRCFAAAALLWALCAPSSIKVQAQVSELLKQEAFSREFSIYIEHSDTSTHYESFSFEYSLYLEAPAFRFSQGVSREISLVVTTPEVPVKISGLIVTRSPSGSSALLDWSTYNEWLQRDVLRYDIYVSTQPFTDIHSLAPKFSVGASIFQATVQDLTEWTDYYFAVVPIDAVGGYDPSVNYASGRMLGKELFSRETSLYVSPSKADSQTISRELSLLVTTPSSPPRITNLVAIASPTGETAYLNWETYDELTYRDIAYYAIYRGTGPITSVEGLAPIATVGAGTRRYSVDGLPAWQDHYFAVVPVDGTEQFDTNVLYSASYILGGEEFSREYSIYINNSPGSAFAQIISREVSLLLPDSSVPAPVTGETNLFIAKSSTNAFSSIDLYWPAYEEAAQRDVVRYRIYAASSLFTNVSGMEPVAFAPAGNGGFRLGGLHGGALYYVAAVAEDALGNWNPKVYPRSQIASVGALGEARNLAINSFANSLQLSWAPPEEVDSFLTSFRLYIGGSSMPIELPASTRFYEISELTPASGYTIRLATVDLFKTESAGITLTGATLLPNPEGVSAQGLDGRVRLSWTHAEPNNLVDHYAIYSSASPFTSVDGLEPIATTRESRMDLVGLENGTELYFAVTTVNVSQGERPGVGAVGAVPGLVTGNFADLGVDYFSAPSSAVEGQTVSLAWQTTNHGTGVTSQQNGFPAASWVDRVILSQNSVFGDADDQVLGVSARNFALAPGGSYSQTASVSLPTGRTGQFFLFLCIDAEDQIFENLDASSNLSMAQGLLITVRPPVPDLFVEKVQAPASVAPEQKVRLTWTIRNQGTAPATGTWRESIFQSTDQVVGNDASVTNVSFTGSIPAGESIGRSVDVLVPFSGLSGEVYWVIRTDSANTISESEETNNVAFTEVPTTISQVLAISTPVQQISENAPNGNIQAIVRRSGPTGSALTLALASSDETELKAPPSITIPVGQSSAIFPLTVQKDQIVDGPQEVAITASAPGFENASAKVTVVDSDVQRLTLSIPSSISEGASAGAVVTREPVSSESLTVVVNSSAPGDLLAPVSVTIPANEAALTFVIVALEDDIIEAARTHFITASAPGFTTASASVTIPANDGPTIEMEIDRPTISEGDGPQAALLTIHRDPVTSQPLTISLESSDPRAARSATSAVIPAGQESVTIQVSAVDDEEVDGTQSTVMTAVALAPSGNPVGAAVKAELTVTDDDGPTLKVAVTPDVLAEGQQVAGKGTIFRNTETSKPLEVRLVIDRPNEASVPATITIQSGSSSADFDIATVADGITDGNRVVTITASVDGFTSGMGTFIVSDENLPDLVISKIDAPTHAVSEEYIQISYRISNKSLATAGGPWLQRVFLSRDPIIGDDLLVSQYTFSGDMPAGLYFEQSVPVRLPLETGDYWVVVTTDVEQTVGETLEQNNSTVTTTPIHVGGAYTATVQADIQTALSNTPVALSGRAFKPDSTEPAPHALVNIHIWVKGTERIISTLTDALGNFNTTFQPLPGEAGYYEIFATHPGVAAADVQDQFVLLGMRVNPSPFNLTVKEGESIVTQATLENLSDVDITGVSAEIIEQSPNIQASVAVSGTTLPGAGTLSLNCSVAVLDASTPVAKLLVRIASAEGATVDVPVDITIQPLRPVLEATPAALAAGMKRGSQKIVEFAITNKGTVPTGELNLLIPNAPWLSSISGGKLPSLAPGESRNLSLLLFPSADLPLGPYTGAIAINGKNVSFQLPFTFRAVSEAKGAFKIVAEDEFTYHAQGFPKLAGATVTILDTTTGAVVKTGVTDLNGEFLAAELVESYYRVEVIAPNHTGYIGTHLIVPEQVKTVPAFLSRQTVEYKWSVVSTEVDDRTKIKIETTFETSVPAPVITIEPNSVDVSDMVDGEIRQIDFTIRNHGLIAAQNMLINPGFRDDFEITPLIRDVGILPPKSSIKLPVIYQKKSGAKSLSFSFLTSQDCLGEFVLEYLDLCGNYKLKRRSSIPVNYKKDCDGTGLPSVGVEIDCPNCVSGPFDWFTFQVPTTEQETKGSCDPCMASAFLGCALSFYPGMPNETCLMFMPISCDFENPNFDSWDCVQQFIGCMPIPKIGPITCLYGIADCYRKSHQQSAQPLKMSQSNKGALNRPIDGVEASLARAYPLISFLQTILNDPEGNWFSQNSSHIFEAWFEAFREFTRTDSVDDVLISDSESRTLTGLPVPEGVTAQAVIDRWNSSLQKMRANEPAASNEFTLQQITSQFRDIIQGNLESRTNGFASSLEEFSEALRRQGTDNGLCARVRLRIDQEVIVSRDGFKAAIEINNGTGDSLQNISVDLLIKDSLGFEQSPVFGLRAPALSNISAVDGTGFLNSQTSGSATWNLIPSSAAAPYGPTKYFISGTLRYTQEGVRLTVPLAPTPIIVHPNANLLIDYFHQRDVFSDDPFTEETEPSIPFSLGVMVKNTGRGEARNVRIVSGQPQIIENEKGLLVDFKIIATEVAGQNLLPSLTANFGNIAPNELKIGRWLLTSTLQGLFVDYKATFEHIDGLGNPKLSLIENVAIHETTRMVDAQEPFADGKPDFLVNDFPDLNDYPDTLYLSDGTVYPVSVVDEGSTSGTPTASSLKAQISATMPIGWTYLRMPEPSDGHFRLVRVVRSDGVEIAFDKNVWTTDRTFIGMGLRPIRENILHLLDFDSTGSYTLFYEPLAALDTAAPQSRIANLPANSGTQIPVQWSGEDGDGSGIAFFDVFVATNDGPFLPWLLRASTSGAIYEGTVGNLYRFYSVATDRSGNRETTPAAAHTQTTVTSGNNAPYIASIGNKTINEGDTLDIIVRGSDPDGSANTLRYTLEPGAPVGAILDPTSGRLTWPTGENQGGRTFEFDVRVTDNGVPTLSSTNSFTVIVNEVNKAPTISPLQDLTISQGNTLNFLVAAADSDFPLQTLTYSLLPGAPAAAVINPVSGVFSWTPPSSHAPGPVTITVQVQDSGTPSLSSTQNFEIMVTRVNRSPVAGADTFGAIEDTPVQVQRSKLLANDYDLDGDLLIMNLTGISTDQGGHVILGPSDLTYTPPTAFTGIDTFRYLIQDSFGVSSIASVTVTVRAKNEQGGNIGEIEILDSGIVRLIYIGIPNLTYTIQSSSDLKDWIELGRATVNENGQLMFDDERGLLQTQFYRLVYP